MRANVSYGQKRWARGNGQFTIWAKPHLAAQYTTLGLFVRTSGMNTSVNRIGERSKSLERKRPKWKWDVNRRIRDALQKNCGHNFVWMITNTNPGEKTLDCSGLKNLNRSLRDPNRSFHLPLTDEKPGRSPSKDCPIYRKRTWRVRRFRSSRFMMGKSQPDQYLSRNDLRREPAWLNL